MNDITVTAAPPVSALEPSNISSSTRSRAPRIRTRHISTPPDRLKPRESKYSLRLGDVERALAQECASEQGVDLADFIRRAVQEKVERHRRVHPKDKLWEKTNPVASADLSGELEENPEDSSI